MYYKYVCLLLKVNVCGEKVKKGVYVEKYSMVIATNLTSIYCVYKEKIVKNDSYRRTIASIQIQKVVVFNLDR